ncbi:histidine phosphatase family protein [Qipengyuania sp. DSG2-2]|uniref:SixA phosphatase family protein n=1 Tax=Qipengyuania sp. DGS2-2 TaxID=3349631 RepID=UPI0036D41ADC
MKRLGILRHAKSDWDDMAKRDFDRGLNDRGRRGAALMGTHIREYTESEGMEWDLLLASPAERVQRTLEAAELDLEPRWNRALYLASAETIADEIREAAEAMDGDPGAILISGHNPGLQDLLLMLVARDKENALFKEACIKFPTATFAVLDIAIDSWAELGGEAGEVVHFKRPRDLDAELGPES